MREYTFQGDNYRFDITGTGDDVLRLALQVAFVKWNFVEDIIEKDNTLILYWAKEDKEKNSLIRLDLDATFSIVQQWLQDKAQYGFEPDHDGSNEEGFRVFNEDWGHVNGDWRAFAAIQPQWIMYGK